MQSRFSLLLLSGTILTVCAVFVSAEQKIVLTGLMLFLPLLDKYTRQINIVVYKQQLLLYSGITGLICLLLLIEPSQQKRFLAILLLTALPEEWFFRRYLQNGLKQYFAAKSMLKNTSASLLAVIGSSALFTLLHLPLQGYIGLATFIPSLILGYAYQMKQDLIFVILLHSLFNLFFMIYLQSVIQQY